MENFINLYSVQKTLRFELKPEGKTLETFNKWIEEIENKNANENSNLIQQDIIRANKYEKVKKIIDEYHKNFIEQALKRLGNNGLPGLEEYYEIYKKRERDKNEVKMFNDIKARMRHHISKALKAHEGFSNLNKDDLIKKKKDANESLLENFLNQNEKVRNKLNELLRDNEGDRVDLFELLRAFENFTTYFRNFHENRQNLYSPEDKFSTIPHRLIHENLPRFCDNIKIYNQAKAARLNMNDIEKELRLNNNSLDEIFSINYFCKTLTQSGIDSYNYIIGGGAIQSGSQNIKGINNFINNDINQNVNNSSGRIPIMKTLYKLPLFERTSYSFRYEPIENDKDLIERIKNFYYEDLKNHRDVDDNENNQVNVISAIKSLIENIHDYREGLYVNGGITLTQISQKIFGSWHYIRDVLSEYYDKSIAPVKLDKKRTKAEEKAKEKWLKQKQFSVKLIEDALCAYKEKETNEEIIKKITETTICDFFKLAGADDNGSNNLFERIESKLTIKNEYDESLADLLGKEFQNERNLMQDKPRTLLIKNFLDTLQGYKDDITAGLLHFIKSLLPSEEISDKNELFYSEFEKYYNILKEVTPLYNKIRNYLTQKPYSVEKVKLNFENNTLLAGWDENKEADNSCVLLRKNNNYYLGIMKKEFNNVFKKDKYLIANDNEPCYEKMIYKLLPGANKMLPKVFFADRNINEFNPSEEILRIRNTASFSKNGTPQEGFNKAQFNLEDCRKLIDFYKKCISNHCDWKNFNFQFSDTDSYQSIDEFYREVEQQGYKVNFVKIPDRYINQLVDEGQLFLFKIYNKDFSDKKKTNGKPNLHTLYWKMLFDENNLKNVRFKLNGEAEIFFRPKSINYTDEIWEKGHHYDKLKDKFNFPIISNKRYALDKFHFHVPITINFKSNNQENINEIVNNYLKNSDKYNIIGIDRGERNLLYVTVINLKGEIIEQFSLNEISTNYRDKCFSKDYHEELDKRESQRDRARKDWQTIEGIRNLKEGFLSHVIHKISQLVIKYNGVVVMEDLNFGFKRGRQKVEKQVYQNFEKMLINKLNYLVFKDKEPDEPGGVLNGYQLVNKFKTFKELGKQSGIVFYVPAAYTSSIDPLTGYVQYLFPIKHANSVEKARNFYNKFKSIYYNPEKEWFEFVFDYIDFNIRFEGKSDWKICTANTERYVWNKNLNSGRGGQEKINVTEGLKLLFREYNILYCDGKNLRELISEVRSINNENTDKKFYNRLNYLLNATLKLRHNNGKQGAEEKDYILSPVKPFFDSRSANKTLPKNADANGAYNIARKGLLLIKRLKELGVEEFEKTKKSRGGRSQWLPHKEWLEFVQNR
jgi:hypothetical protein